MANKINWKKYLFRSSQLSNIMSGSVGLSEAQRKDFEYLKSIKGKPIGLTDKQQKLMDDLKTRDKTTGLTSKQSDTLDELKRKSKAVKELTPKQKEKFDEYSAIEKDESLPVGVQNYLKKLYREEKYNRRKRLESKYVLKGIAQEDEAITMYSEYTGYAFINNKERINNDYITGEYDIYIGDDVDSIVEGFDTKCSYDLSTFPFKDEPLNTNYYYQNMCYMWLSGAKKWTTVYCLTNTPDKMIKDMIYREDFRWDMDDAPDHAKLSILNNHVYDDSNFARLMMIHDCIPEPELETEDNVKSIDVVNNFIPMELEERIIEKVVHRDDKVIEDIKKRIDLCRKFLINLETKK
jgi:hypothetical protein